MKIKLYYDPNAELGAAPAAVVPVVVEPVVDTTPKTKEDWQKLAQDNPARWIDLTQQNMDRVTRESRELKEKLEREQQEKNNLSQELNRYKQPVPNIEKPDGQKHDLNNLPKNKDEWDTLFIENPAYATDLRFAANNRVNHANIEFQRAFSTAQKEVQVEHPEMYILEVDATGQSIKDGNGKPVIKKDQNGHPIYNANSDKGKIWEEIWKDSTRPDGTNPLSSLPNAPILMMAELERRLVKRGTQMIQQTPELRQNQVAPQGVPPPVASVKVKFATDAEKQVAEKRVQQGVYKSLEEYCQHRDNGNLGIYDTNRRPDFAKKS